MTQRQMESPLVSGWRAWAAWLLFWSVVGLLGFGYYYLDVLVRDGSDPFQITLIEEMTGGYATGLLSLAIIKIARYIQGNAFPWHRAVLLHAGIAPLYSAAHTTLLWSSRVVITPLLGLGPYDYGRMPLRYLMEAGNDLLDYVIIAALLHLLLHYRTAQRRALRLAELENELTQARLKALEGQLRPHFLFNTLNTVSSIMYRDVRAADRVLTQLGDLLRSSLKADNTHEVTVEEEIKALETYLDVMRARFGDRLTVDVRVDPATTAAMVPYLILQPIVENAIEHGDPEANRPAHITIAVERRSQTLLLSVGDNGNGAPNGTVQFGVGLRNTSARLDTLYPDAHSLSMGNGGDGFRVEITIPFQE